MSEASVIDALAVCRLSRLVREDTILDKPRHALSVHMRHERWFPKFIRCPWCVSMWCAFGVVGLRLTVPRLWDPLARCLAASYVASLAALHVEPQD